VNYARPWPQKTHEVHSHHFDSTIWNDFNFRDDDIIIATYAKAGTTWMQQIIAPKEVKLPLVEAQSHRRFLKTHLPVDALVDSPRARYIYIGRDGRDVVWSVYNHHVNANALWYQALNDTPGRVGPSCLIRTVPCSTSCAHCRSANGRRLHHGARHDGLDELHSGNWRNVWEF
jgi:Sulfotransferase domain